MPRVTLHIKFDIFSLMGSKKPSAPAVKVSEEICGAASSYRGVQADLHPLSVDCNSLCYDRWSLQLLTHNNLKRN